MVPSAGMGEQRLVRCRAAAVAACLAGAVAVAGAARDPLAAARQLYNAGDYAGAIAAAEEITQPQL
ncbi:MAG: hypothetical protein ACRD09_07485, partial [Vicinamibacterales bacterium]